MSHGQNLISTSGEPEFVAQLLPIDLTESNDGKIFGRTTDRKVSVGVLNNFLSEFTSILFN
jgi:hypothetical protein